MKVRALPAHLFGDEASDAEKQAVYDDEAGNRVLASLLRHRFEGREAIYVGGGAWRVRITGIRTFLRERIIEADVEAFPTPGLSEPPMPRWDIGAGSETTVSADTWAMGYGGWTLYFAPRVVGGVMELAAGLPADMEPHERYRAVLRWLSDDARPFRMSDAYVPPGRVFPDEAERV